MNSNYKKIMAILLAVLMLNSMVSVTAFAAYTAKIQSGTADGVFLKETLSDGTYITEDMLFLATNSSNKVTLPSEAYYERENYVQDGWTKTASGKGTLLKFGSIQSVRNNTTKFYPHWQQCIFVVTFNAGAVYDSTDARNYTDSTMTTLLETTTKTDGTSEMPVVFPEAMFYREGYTQTGWCKSRTGDTSVKYDFGSTYDGTISGDTNFYPYWTVNTYTFSYLPGEYGEGTEIINSVEYNDTIYLEDSIFTRDGYTQMGWSLVDGGDWIYNFGEKLTVVGDITLYPYWVKNQCGSNLNHTWENGLCLGCGAVCGTDVKHVWENGVCTVCNNICGTDVEHTWVNGVCTICGVVCGIDVLHEFEDRVCKICDIVCGTDMEHVWETGVCSICGFSCEHLFESGICTVCGDYEPATPVTAENYKALNLTESYIGYYAIGNLGQLSWFRDFVNENIQLSGVDTDDITDDVYSSSANAVLINDIDMNPERILDFTGNITGTPGVYDENGDQLPEGSMNLIQWYTGIGLSSSLPYEGVFDGNSFSIKDIMAVDTGVFEHNKGTIKNLEIISGVFLCGNYYTGAICGVNMGRISNCSSYAMGSSGYEEIGAICGYNKGGKISDCVNYGVISGGAGICGKNEGGTITNCANYGAADCSGICGINRGTIENCFNTGSIVANENLAGGICAYSEGGVIKKCYNLGKVTATNRGDIGAICGSITGTVIENCYYLESCATDGDGVIQFGIGNENLGTATEDIDGATISKTAEQFASGEVCYLLNDGVTDGTQVFYQNIDNGEDVDASPAFLGGTVYKVGPCTGIKAYTNIEADGVCEHTWENDICSTCGFGLIKAVSDKTKIDHIGKNIFTELFLCGSLDDIITTIDSYTTKLTASLGDFIGTGSVVEVLDAEKNTFSIYTVVVANDINGDSVCDVLDCAQIARVANGYETIDGAYELAADTDGNGEVNEADYQSIVNFALQ